jgi:hypothetical protein
MLGQTLVLKQMTFLNNVRKVGRLFPLYISIAISKAPYQGNDVLEYKIPYLC